MLAVAPFFWYGNPSGHDFEFHVYSWMDVASQWKHGVAFPRWAALANWGYGDPRFLFYPPASWTIGAALGSVLPWSVVPGVYCWGVLTLAGLSMYRLARQWLRKKDAMFAAMFYALNPYHLLIVYWRSAFAELLAGAVIPLVLLYVVRLNNASLEQQSMIAEGDLESKGGVAPREFAASAVGLTLALTAAWLTNLPAAVMIHYSVAALAVFFALRLVVRKRISSDVAWVQELSRPLLATAGAIVMAMGLVGFYLLPAIYEQRWVNISEVLSPGVRPQDNFLFTTIQDPDHNRFNALVSVLASAEILALCLAVAQSRIYRARRNRSALAGPVPGTTIKSASTGWLLFSMWGLGSGFLMLSQTNPVWQHLPKLRYVQLPFRWLLCLNAALAMLLAMATRRWFPRLLVCGLLLLTLLTAGHLTQPPWWDTAADIREMSDFMENGTGYEGTGEYVPAGADASELKRDIARVSDESGRALPSKIIEWQAERIHFTVPSKKPMNIVVRLFNYPAWEVSVNGKVVGSASTEATGLMSLPISRGENDVRIRFRRSNDRIIGMIISLISLLIIAGAWIYATHVRGQKVQPRQSWQS